MEATARLCSHLREETNPRVAAQGDITIDEPTSPLVIGVTCLRAQSSFQSAGGAINGGVVVARWSLGGVLIVRGVKDGRKYAAINMYPLLYR
jgi:hypothetical protein